MNLGLGNLITLKTQLLAAELVASTDWDSKLAKIGLGVAASFDKFCNRGLAYFDGESDIFTADRQCWCLSRFPVVGITQVRIRTDLVSGFVSQGTISQALRNWDTTSGLVEFGAVQGDAASQVQILYAGGYWFDPADAGDAEGDIGDMPATIPDGATLLPADITEAWLLQCQNVWEKNDALAKTLLGGSSRSGNALVGLSLAGLDLVPSVKATLSHYLRYQIS
jgi:hypothetical protein